MKNSEEFNAAMSEAVSLADSNGQGTPLDMIVETPDGDLLEIEKVYWSPVNGGQVRIKAKGYDDEYDPEDERESDEAEIDSADISRAKNMLRQGLVVPIADVPGF